MIYDANADALEGLEWEWTTALDSRVCPQCQPLDGERWKQGEKKPQWPLHPNCRCQAVMVDPEDDEFANQARNAQQIRPLSEGPYKGPTAKTPIAVWPKVLQADRQGDIRHAASALFGRVGKWANSSDVVSLRRLVAVRWPSGRIGLSASWMNSTGTLSRSCNRC